jgi:hypothetical protein
MIDDFLGVTDKQLAGFRLVRQLYCRTSARGSSATAAPTDHSIPVSRFSGAP